MVNVHTLNGRTGRMKKPAVLECGLKIAHFKI